jgi:hypothetical protein
MKYEFTSINIIEYGWIKAYYISEQSISLYTADRITVSYVNNETYYAIVIKTGSDADGDYIVLHHLYKKGIHNGVLEIKRTFSPMISIDGAKDLISLYEYWPSFHDDEITLVKMENDEISIDILMHTKPNNTDVEYRISLIFTGIESMQLEGWYSCNIILDIEFEYVDDNINVSISGSLGLAGSIVCRNISVELRN